MQTPRTQLKLWTDLQQNGLLQRLPPSRHRVRGLRFLDRLVVPRPPTLLRLFQLILGFWRRRQGYSRER